MPLHNYIKKIILLSSCFGAMTVNADDTLPDVTMNISLNVVEVTCQVNNGDGFNKIVDFGLINEQDLISGTVPQEKVQFIVDCKSSNIKPESIDIKMTAGNQGAVNGGLDGQLKTSLNGVGIKLTWLDGASIALNNTSKNFTSSATNQFDVAFYAKPFAITPAVDKGQFKSSVIINMLYK